MDRERAPRVVQWFRGIHAETAAAYAEFADKLVQAGDVIVTFNYDDSLERELKRSGKWDLSDGYGFPFAEPGRSQVLPLKLHGSMNWLWPVPSLGKRPLIHQADVEPWATQVLLISLPTCKGMAVRFRA